MSYKPGDQANGHVLGQDKVWHRLPESPPATPPAATTHSVAPTPPDQMEVRGHTGSVIWDGQFVTLRRTGFLARASIGKGEKRVPLRSITAVQWKPAGPLVNGFIQFTLGGGNESRSRFGAQTTDAGHDENSVIFTRKQMPQFAALRAAVESAIADRGRPASALPPAAPDHLAQLKQLAELRDGGVISDDEFQAKKVELLGRL